MSQNNEPNHENNIRLSSQISLNSLLETILEDYSIEEQLQAALDILLDISWLTIENRGSIFLLDQESGDLILTVHHNLEPNLLKSCQRIKPGVCLCGRALQNKEIIFTTHLTEEHENRYDNIKPHGHYCVPLLFNEKVVGVLNLYVPEGYQKRTDEKTFLLTFSTKLASIIHRRQEEQNLTHTKDSNELIRLLLESAIEPVTLQDQLDQIMMLLFFLPWLPIQPKGAIFLLDKESQELVLRSYSHDLDYLLERCSRVPIGKCLCGRAAISHEMIVVTEVNEQHEIEPGKPEPHGHCCIPIRHNDQVLGVINLYLFEGQSLSRENRLFLSSVATVLSIIINRKQMDNQILFSLEQLTDAKQASEHANQAKSDFLANMSHEIRTPMNAIMGLNDLALNHDLHPKVRDYLRKMRTASKSLLRIINDILDFSKIEAGKLDMEQIPFNLLEIFDNLGNLFRGQIIDQNIEFVLALPYDLSMEMIGDPLRLEQVFINLISNACKFTQTGEVVTRAELLEQTQQAVHIQFSVKDNGIGISPEQQTKLFSAFSQADNSTTRHFGGTGLGLTISRRLVEMMGGHMWVESALGEGSTFFFDIWLTIGLKGMHRATALPNDLQDLKVLVVDDNDLSRQILTEKLQILNLNVTSVSSGKQALETLQAANHNHDPFALVVTDYRMPEMNGLETAVAIQKETDLFHTLPHLSPPVTIPKILLMTTFTGDEVQKRAEACGLDGFMEKPCSHLLMFDTIQEIFGKEVPRSHQNQNITDLSRQLRTTIPGAHILLVDDIDLNRQVGRELLESMGLSITLANNGLEAVQKTDHSGPFDAILMDLQMPKLDGYDATRTIRQNPAHTTLPIIAMTAHAMGDILDKCKEAGMNDHVAKPIDVVTLCKTLLRWIPPKTSSIQNKDDSPSPDTLQQQDSTEQITVYLPETIAGIDIPSALQRMNNSKRLLRDMLLGFNQDFAHVATTIRTSLQEQKEEGRASARVLVHTIKGMAGNLSANALFQASRKLEDGIKTEQNQEWPLLFAQFEQAFLEVLHSIQAMEEEIGQNSDLISKEVTAQPILDEMELQSLTQKLYDSINRSHSNATQVLATLKPTLQAGAIRHEMEQLEECLNQYDFERALTHLKTIAKIQNIRLSVKPS